VVDWRPFTRETIARARARDLRIAAEQQAEHEAALANPSTRRNAVWKQAMQRYVHARSVERKRTRTDRTAVRTARKEDPVERARWLREIHEEEAKRVAEKKAAREERRRVKQRKLARIMREFADSRIKNLMGRAYVSTNRITKLNMLLALSNILRMSLLNTVLTAHAKVSVNHVMNEIVRVLGSLYGRDDARFLVKTDSKQERSLLNDAFDSFVYAGSMANELASATGVTYWPERKVVKKPSEDAKFTIAHILRELSDLSTYEEESFTLPASSALVVTEAVQGKVDEPPEDDSGEEPDDASRQAIMNALRKSNASSSSSSSSSSSKPTDESSKADDNDDNDDNADNDDNDDNDDGGSTTTRPVGDEETKSTTSLLKGTTTFTYKKMQYSVADGIITMTPGRGVLPIRIYDADRYIVRAANKALRDKANRLRLEANRLLPPGPVVIHPNLPTLGDDESSSDSDRNRRPMKRRRQGTRCYGMEHDPPYYTQRSSTCTLM